MIQTMLVDTPNKGSLNMRNRPAKNADIIANIPNGTPVGVTGEDGDWKQIDYYGTSGWVMAKYLIEPKEDPTGLALVPRNELEKVYDTIGDWLGLRG